MEMYGYIRISSKDQREDRQEVAMLAYGVPKENLVVEKQSGKDFERPIYKCLTNRLRGGDILVLKSIDRLGRNYEEILEQWRYLTREKEAAIVVLDMPLLDTRRDRDLTGVLISDIVLQLLSYVAQTEREFIHQRQAEGIAAAKARGVRFGNPGIPLPENFEAVAKSWRRKEITLAQALEILGVGRSYFYRRVKKLGI